MASCCSLLAVLVAAIAVLAGTGVLFRGLNAILVSAGKYDAIGLNPAFLSANELKKAKYSDLKDGALNGQVCLVTGGNVGLGYETAFNLADKGCEVIVTGRRFDACKTACEDITKRTKNGKCKPMLADLGSLKSVKTFCKDFTEKYERLDIFVQNAGVTFWSGQQMSADGIESMFAINHVGHFAMTKCLSELLEKTADEQGHSQVSIVSSSAHYTTVPGGVFLTLKDINDDKKFSGLTTYGQSKFANILFSNELSRRMQKKGKNVLVNSCHPGLVATNTTGLWKERVKASVREHPTWEVLGKFLLQTFEFIERNIAWTSSDGARTQFWVATSPEIIENRVTGKYFHPLAQEVPVHELAQDKELQRKFWDFSESILTEKGFN